MSKTNRKRTSRKWYSMDLHLHTPASSDYQQKNVPYLDILKQAEARGLDIIAFTDHNTVAGYRRLLDVIKQLSLLKKLNRILPEEEVRLNEYDRLMKKILVLPGFEFTATFGFHILAIFPPEKSLREIEHLLLELNIPPEELDNGPITVGASSDVLTAYKVINEAGGLVIAAHANSSNGIAMRGFPLGGQTKIAYTQNEFLHALEVTDLEKRGRHTTASFFRGTKPEYPRRMHCIQGSDSHRLKTDTKSKKHLGVGDRATEVLLPEVNFQAILNLFKSNDFSRTRPRRQQKGGADFDYVKSAREEGANIIQDFHESMTVRGGKLYAIIADVAALANTNGGSLYVGFSGDPKTPIAGVNNPTQAIAQLEKEISNRISPPITCSLDVHKTGGKNIVSILVPRGEDPPYAVDDNKIYIRDEAETNLAVRDEIVGLVKRGRPVTFPTGEEPISLVPKALEQVVAPQLEQDFQAPRTGVEIVNVIERKGVKYFTVKDLRNGNVVKNVTVKSARRLWHYAITSFAGLPKDMTETKVDWRGKIGILRKYKQGKRQVFDLVQKDKDKTRVYFGVTEDGVHGAWRELVGLEGEE